MFQFSVSPFTRWPMLASTAFALTVAGCGYEQTPRAVNATGSSADDSAADTAVSEDATFVVQPIEVPNGTPEELFAFIDELDRQLDVREPALDGEESGSAGTGRLAPQTRQAIALRRVMEARVDATDKILVRQVPEETRLRAITIQLDALRTLVALDPQGIAERFDQYTLRIAEGQDPLLSRLARATRFQANVTRSLSGSEPTASELLAQLQSLLDDPQAGPETFNATREAAGWLAQSGDRVTSAEALRRIGRRFADHSDATLAAEGAHLISQATNLELMELAAAVVEERPQALEQLFSRLEQLLSAENDTDPNLLAYAMQTAQLLEFTGNVNEALKSYRLIGERFQDHADAALVRDVKRSVELAERRLGLIGQPLAIEGAQLSGNALDWSTYRGKWVLVCFWATWHDQWPKELENIRQSIEPYRDPPVAVVSISLDNDRNPLERFLKENPAPWPVLVNPDPLAGGFENPNAVRCGVEAVPFILLVNPEGIVVDLHLMGQRLPTALAKHLGK